MNYFIAIYNFIKIRYFEKFKDSNHLQRFQENKMKKHLKYVKNHSPYYKDIDEFKKIEIINKSIMMDSFNCINTVNADKEECLKIAINSEHSRDFTTKYMSYTVGLSSGTSGNRGLFILSDKEVLQWAGAVLAKVLPRKKIFGHKIAFFLRADNNLYESINSIFVKFKFFDMINDMNENVKKLRDFNPTILIAPSSIIKEIAKIIEKNNYVEINPIKIISVAEVLNESDERYIKKVFKKDVIHQVYQCTEGFLGYTCEYGNIHINEDIVKIEKEEIDEERFIPIVTDYYRRTQPIIRYRLNDVLISSDEPCKCGSCLMRIKKIEGREDDIFIFENVNENEDVKVHGDFISRCLVYVEDINNYKVFQNSKNQVTIYIDNIEEKIKKSIIEQFKILSEKMSFKLPEIKFDKYKTEKLKKMKRIERGF